MNRELIKKIKKEIELEQALFNENKSYLSQNKKEIKALIIDRLKKDANYSYYAFGYFERLDELGVLDPNDQDSSFILELVKEERMEASRRKEDFLDYSFLIASNRFGIRQHEDYAHMMKKRIMPIDELLYYINFQLGMDLYIWGDVYNFAITNNYLFNNYPELFDEQYVKNVQNILEPVNRKQFSSRAYYSDFKRAREKFYNNVGLNKKETGIKEKTKSLFKKIIKK